MFEEVHKLSDFLLGLLHAGHVVKLDFDVPDPLDFVALLGRQLGHKGIRSHPPEDEDGEGYPEEGG